MNKRYATGLGIIAMCTVIAAFAFQGSLTPYVSFVEARELDRSCQVMGVIDKDNVSYDAQAGVLSFAIVDEDGEVLSIAFEGVTPGNFDQAESVVCKGQFVDGTFEANQLLVKCPSKYQGLEAAGEEIPHEAEEPSGTI